jgi:pectate lyase
VPEFCGRLLEYAAPMNAYSGWWTRCRFAAVGGLLLLSHGVAGAQPAFPGAEGFGATVTGGRGGTVRYVTRLDPDPNGLLEGSLNWALRQPDSYVLFKVSGVIHAPARVRAPNITLAGQTSPGGIIVRGLVCDGHYERNDCSNLIVRHLRSRPAAHRGVPDGGEALDDALRLDGIRGFIIDSSSFAHASDEAAQISWASQGSIQRSIIAETVGEHAELGGMLINYSHPDFPQDRLSLHHNLWFRLGGRLPEIGCEASNYQHLEGSVADCQQRPLQLELSHNLFFDPGINLWYNRSVDQNDALGPYRLQFNMVDNLALVRPNHGFGLLDISLLSVADNELFVSGNRMSRWPEYSDYELAYCCNDFPDGGPNTEFGVAQRLSERHPFPAITPPVEPLAEALLARVGAAPTDPMDRRILARLRCRIPTELNHAIPQAEDAFALDFDPAAAPAAPLDSDGDGMPDSFELEFAHLGLDPQIADHNGEQLSVPLTGVAGYRNLEVYLNLLADSRAAAAPTSVFCDGFGAL